MRRIYSVGKLNKRTVRSKATGEQHNRKMHNHASTCHHDSLSALRKKNYCYSSRHIFETVGTAIPFSPSIGYIGPTAIHLLSTANNPARQPCLKLTEAPYVNKVVICIQVFFSFRPLFYNVSHRPSHLTTSISDFRQKDEEIFDNFKSL